MADSPEAQKAADAITAKLMADPVLGPLLQRQAAGQPFDANAADARLKAVGIELPPGMWISKGKVQHENMTVDNIGKALKIALPVAMGASLLAGPIGAGAAAGGGATAGAGAGASGAAAGGVAAAAGPSIWKSLAGPLIGAGTAIGSAAIQAHSNSEAVKAEQEAADKALALQERMFNQRRADEAGFRQISTGALGLLGQGMGIDMTPPVPEQPPQTSQAAATNAMNGATAGTLAQMGPPPQMSMPTNPALGSEPMVRVYSPTGSVGQVPQSKLQAALAAGGRMA